MDTYDISNKELLPVTSIAYGPMELEAQSAKIEIGRLICYPQENSYNVKSYINSLETRLNMTDEILEEHDNQIGEIQEMVTLSDQTLDRHETLINDLSTDRCSSNPCINGGTCTNTVNNYICSCKHGIGGRNCEIDTIDECQSSPCQNGGICFDSFGAFQCICKPGYEGSNCETINFICPTERTDFR